MIIMNVVNLWQSSAITSFMPEGSTIPASLYADILAKGAAAVMAVSVMNSLGRIIWGRVSDRFGREKTLAVIFAVCGISFAIINIAEGFGPFSAGIMLTGFCFGGFLALYPAMTADYFGIKNIGANYGLMFTAYGAGGLVGPWLAPKLLKNAHAVPYQIDNEALTRTIETGNYGISLLLAGGLCLMAAAVIAGWNKKRAVNSCPR